MSKRQQQIARDLEFPWWCERGCYAGMACTGEKTLWVNRIMIKYEFWTCPKCGNTLRVCVWRRKKNNA